MTTELEHLHRDVANTVVARLMSRPRGGFHREGEAFCREQVEGALHALVRDLEQSKHEALRAFIQAFTEKIHRFSDLRFFTQTLHDSMCAALDVEANAQLPRAAIERWLFELVLVGTMTLAAQREEVLQREAALDATRVHELQLAKLKVALDEKTQLLELVREASTPIAEVVAGILVVPLVGTFDPLRIELLTEKLLREVSDTKARIAILDVSGVPVFDTEAAHLLIRVARALRLLGAQTFLVGLSPESARTIVDLGIELGGIRTVGTLRNGLARALELQQLKIAPLERS